MNKTDSFTIEFKDKFFNDFNILEKKVKVTSNPIEVEDGYEYNMEPFKEYNQSRENYVQLMDIFLNRKDKRKLGRKKGFKSFTDRIYGR